MLLFFRQNESDFLKNSWKFRIQMLVNWLLNPMCKIKQLKNLVNNTMTSNICEKKLYRLCGVHKWRRLKIGNFYPLFPLDVFFRCPVILLVQIYTGLNQFSVSKLFGPKGKLCSEKSFWSSSQIKSVRPIDGQGVFT